MKEKEAEGYGECEDCIWYHDPKGCNVERDSKLCLLNRKIVCEKDTALPHTNQDQPQ